MRKLLLVRPEPGLSASAGRARAMGLDIAAVPFFEIVPVGWTPPTGPFDAMLLTSANAVRHGGPGLSGFAHLPVHAVGDATAQAAKEAGLEVASVGTGGVTELLESLPPSVTLFHPGGRHRTATASRCRIVDVTVYESVVIDPVALPDLSGWVVALHSPRAGARLAQLVRERDRVGIAAISPAAAQACGTGWQSIDIAAEPSDESLLALAAKLCQTDQP